MVSVVIPARNEKFLNPTILDILNKVKGEYEIIVHLDGYWPDDIVKHDNVKYIHSGEVCGMRAGINKAVAISEGEYIFKLDGHCMVSEGFDVALSSICQEDWMITPLRKRLDPVKWEIQIQPPSKPDISYSYLSYPEDPADWGGPGLNGKIWTDKILANQGRGIFIDDLIAAQGSGWFMSKKLFQKAQLLDEEMFGPFWAENQEQTFAVVLRAGGRSVIYTGAWYGHWHKGKPKKEEIAGKEELIGGRGYHLREQWLKQGRNAVMRFFNGERVWVDQKYPLSHLIEMHMPMPEWSHEKLNQLKERERANGWYL